MSDPVSFIDRLQQEWRVIAGAPFSFTAAVLVTCAVVYAIMRWHFNALRDQKDEQLKTKEERLAAKEDDIANLHKRLDELTEQLQRTAAKLDAYIREDTRGFRPTVDRVVKGLLALDDIPRKVPIKIIATADAHPFAEHLKTALTSIKYGVPPDTGTTHSIIPARIPHNKILVRYEEKTLDPLHNNLCQNMSAALQHIIAHDVQLFPKDGGRDYFQIELGGEP
jgi:hypothetical protein